MIRTTGTTATKRINAIAKSCRCVLVLDADVDVVAVVVVAVGAVPVAGGDAPTVTAKVVTGPAPAGPDGDAVEALVLEDMTVAVNVCGMIKDTQTHENRIRESCQC
jgi:hypothetical protein